MKLVFGAPTRRMWYRSLDEHVVELRTFCDLAKMSWCYRAGLHSWGDSFCADANVPSQRVQRCHRGRAGTL